MTDAEKREKVIRGLKCCIDPEVPCRECPYYNYGHCDPDDVRRDALALLKEQEPRVLEYSEIEKHPLVWLEDNDKEDVIPALFLQYNGWSAEFSRQSPDKYVDTIIRSAKVVADERTYGKTWRVWTFRPTPGQMRDTKWEGDADEM
jgi:hypothetical protein